MPPNNAPTTSNHNHNPNEAPGAPGPPPGFIPFQIPTLPPAPLERQIAASLMGELAEAMDTPLVPGFESFDFDLDIDGPRPDHGSQSSTSDAGSDTGSELLCTICSRRQKRVRYVACGHRTCASCTKKLWWSMIRRAGRARDPWPASIPCPFCRAAVTAVVDEGEEGGEEEEDVVGGVCAAVSGLVTGGGADASGVAADGGGAGGLDVAGGGVKGEGVLIVDWMLVRSKHALWRLRLETAERVVVAGHGGGGGAADGGEGRAWGGGEMPDWNEFFFD